MVAAGEASEKERERESERQRRLKDMLSHGGVMKWRKSCSAGRI